MMIIRSDNEDDDRDFEQIIVWLIVNSDDEDDEADDDGHVYMNIVIY